MLSPNPHGEAPSSFRRISLVSCLATLPVCAQVLPAPVIVSNTPAPEAPAARNASDGAIFTRKDARTITLKIPAPRGQIVDRDGEPLAQNRVAYQVALQFRQFENADRDFVINWARTRLDSLQALVKNAVPKTDDELYDHYRHRRWLPLLVTGQIGEKEARDIESKLTSGLVLQSDLPPVLSGGRAGRAHHRLLRQRRQAADRSDQFQRTAVGGIRRPRRIGKTLQHPAHRRTGHEAAAVRRDRQQAAGRTGETPAPGRHAGHHARSRLAETRRENPAQGLPPRGLRGHRCGHRRGAGDGFAAVVRSEQLHPRHQRDGFQGARRGSVHSRCSAAPSSRPIRRRPPTSRSSRSPRSTTARSPPPPRFTARPPSPSAARFSTTGARRPRARST